ncbi:hypothetical protein L21SP2_2819 [Salinispira pacifica]|uniref:Uncharacterized protein n=1 Tax=Salinispira pacifica TaxID=1307761 RepID=V5WKV2_9SPIO|nr:hypothetical protein L21SP2_2819 [Salinispira pacifica]
MVCDATAGLKLLFWKTDNLTTGHGELPGDAFHAVPRPQSGPQPRARP